MDQRTTSLRDRTIAYAAVDAVAGREQAMVWQLVEDLEPWVDEIDVDPFGNIFGTRHAVQRDARKLMVAAHSDEIGALVKSVEPTGAIRFEPVGGVSETLMVGRAVRVDGVPGVIGVKAGHISTPEERRQSPSFQDMYVDVGCDSAEDVAALNIMVGSQIAYDAPARIMADGHRMAGKALDNRIGCAIVVELAKALHNVDLPCTVQFVVTAQEEVGLRGAKMITHRLQPDAAIVIDTMPAGGTPDVSSTRHLTMEMGNGPVLTLVTRSGASGGYTQAGMDRFLTAVADDHEIAIQRGLFYGGTSDAAAVHLVGAGVPTAAVNVARRYSHSPVEMLDLRDAAGAYSWTRAAIEKFDATVDLSFLGDGRFSG